MRDVPPSDLPLDADEVVAIASFLLLEQHGSLLPHGRLSYVPVTIAERPAALAVNSEEGER